MSEPKLLSSDPKAGQLLSEDPSAATFTGSNEKDASGNATVDPNTVGTFAKHVGSQLNPLSAIQALSNATVHPLDTLKAIGVAQGQIGQRAKESFDKGDYVGAAAHALYYLMPLIGPQLDKAGNDMRSGKIAAGAGDAVGLGLGLAGPGALAEAAPRVMAKVASSGAGTAAADALDTAANAKVVKTMVPTKGPNLTRFGNTAADVAPTVVREAGGLSRSGLQASIESKLGNATDALDEATNARLNAKSYPTKPVLDRLQASRDRLTSQAVEGSTIPKPGEAPQPLGQDVVPGPNAARVAQIDQATKEIQQLGPVARYEALRRIREAYDGPAKAVYSPSMTSDYMTAQGGKLGAADVTGALREHLGTIDPNTAAANAQYSLWKKASDVMQAAEETERVRPTVGRDMLARGVAAAGGAAIGGPTGALVGGVLGPTIEHVLMNTKPAMRLVVARQMASIADALRAGDSTKASALVSTLQKMVPAGVAAQTPAPAPFNPALPAGVVAQK